MTAKDFGRGKILARGTRLILVLHLKLAKTKVTNRNVPFTIQPDIVRLEVVITTKVM